MKLLQIMREKFVPKTKKELANDKERISRGEFSTELIQEEKIVQLKEPVYIVAMSMKELQLVSFYLELENRKPIVNIEITKEKLE